MPVGTTTDSLSIGMNVYNGPGYPNRFNGLIDDIRVYDSVLTDSQIVHYGDTCGRISVQPLPSITHVGGNTVFTVHSSIVAATYQWQADAGTGFTNLSNSGPYSGVTTNTLTVSGVTMSMNNYHYRCIVSNTWVCSDTSASALLTTTTGINQVSLNDQISVYPNPVKNTVFVQLPYSGTSGYIQVLNSIGQIMLEKKADAERVTLDISSLPSGIYIVKLGLDNQTAYRKVIKI